MTATLPQKIALALAGTWFLAAAASLLTSLLTDVLSPGLRAELYFLAVTVCSPVAFAAFGWDKFQAKRDGWRVPEKTLHLLSFLGGWPGSVIAQHMFRHKTVKPAFRVVLTLIVVAHVGLTAIAAGKQLFGE